uniref:FAD/NAD(P)-binding domain-containing protein n=1 Tax=Ciona savignyi TaxID=51511 RepID=H2YWN8_CIOSA
MMIRCVRFGDLSCSASKVLLQKQTPKAQAVIVARYQNQALPARSIQNGASFSQQHGYKYDESSKFGSSFCIVGGVAFLGIGVYKYFTESKANAAEVVGSTEANDQEVEDVLGVPPVPELPAQVQYLLIGGGTASYAAMRAIKKRDVSAKVLIISEEAHLPYMRPPLSKELWYSDDRDLAKNLEFKTWNGKKRNVYYEKPDYYCEPGELPSKSEGGVAVANNKKVASINPVDNVVTLEDGTEIKYEKCLIATGGQPRNLPIFKKSSEEIQSKVSVYRTASDFSELDKLTDEVKSVTVIGGGFMGSELSCALGHKGKQAGFEVNQVFPESGNMGNVLPEYLTKWTTGKVQREGVNVITGTVVNDVSMEDGRLKLQLRSGQEIITDHVVVAVGLNIDTSLADSAGLETDDKLGGYRVNAELQARSNIWVAGDASCFFDAKLGRRRVEHHDHAVVSGRLAGENMTGAQKPYYHQSMFWSDLGPEVGYEAIGIIDSTLPTVGVFAKATAQDTPRAAEESGLRADADESTKNAEVSTKPSPTSEEFGKGVVFYLRQQKVVGVLLWNVFGRMPIARKVIRDQEAYGDYTEVAKLFKIHSDELD